MHLLFIVIWCLLGLMPDYVEMSCYNPPSELCTNDMVEIPSLETRDPSVMTTNETSHWTFCDVYSIDTNTWYKSGIPMTTLCPSMYMCGAKFPIWMNGENPSPGDGLVNRTSCCVRTYRMTAVN
ncbi:pancreatic secretory granule membrane major glycoprotein GP2-like, partial [Ruditapes philippinarum]|uniref:pancreatic secretory granule membrane major glycoprotein GP2-like n=1 Tax=Ruditapes philippinarum TaxID=129788 RepID=UPI00295B1EE5